MQERTRNRLPPDPLEDFIEVREAGDVCHQPAGRHENQAWKVFRGCYLQHQASCEIPGTATLAAREHPSDVTTRVIRPTVG